MLVLSRKIEQGITVGDTIEIRVLGVSAMDRPDGTRSKVASIGIDAPREINILRSELKQTMDQNIEAEKSVRNITGEGLASILKKKRQLPISESNDR